MKWRQSVIYLILLVLVGAYFYYFEVVKKEEKEAAEKEAKKVFQLKTDDIHALDVQSKDKKPVQLKREGDWKIVAPFDADTDGAAVKNLLSSLSNLESQREVMASAEDLEPFGLQEPPFKLRFQAGEQWSDLLVGDKNPVGGGYYAKVGDKPKVFLISESSWGGLNKGLDELRRSALFSFQPDDVSAIKLTWRDGATVSLKKSESGDGWNAPDRPDVKIKDSKAKNVLEQIQWLKAQKFVEDRADNLDVHGLGSPLVTVEFTLKNEGKVELKVAKKGEDGKEVVALSSDLSAVVGVAGDFLDDLPKSLQALEDRSLLSLKKEEVKEVRWQVGEERGSVVQTAKDKWSLKKGDGEPKPLNDSWRVSSLLWDLDEAEYDKKAEPVLSVPENPHGRLEFRDGEKMLQTLIWNETSGNDEESLNLWIQTGEAPPEAVLVGAEVVEKLEQDLEGFEESPQSGKEAS
jgi:hypothetical protein